MATVLDFLGLSAPGLTRCRRRIRQAEAAVKAGELALKLVETDRRPSQILTRAAFENAISAVAATGGSTNGVLHLLAIAAEAGVELTIDDFDTISARTPIVADIKPGGRYVARISSAPAAWRSSRASSCARASCNGTRRTSTGARSRRSPRARTSAGPGRRRLDGTRR
jgi:hypothetical protein